MVNLDNTEIPPMKAAANAAVPNRQNMRPVMIQANLELPDENKSDSEEGEDSDTESVDPHELLIWYQRMTQARKRKDEEVQGEMEYKKRKLEAYEERNRIMAELTLQRKKLNEVLEKYVAYLTGKAKAEANIFANSTYVDPEAVDKLSIGSTNATEVINKCDSNTDNNYLNITTCASTSTDTVDVVGNSTCANTD